MPSDSMRYQEVEILQAHSRVSLSLTSKRRQWWRTLSL